jgi:glycosyltransferase involved in cell wall biosynthesis
MRILIINSEYPPIGGGAGNASANIAKELAATGQEVTVLTSSYADMPRLEVHNGVRIYRAKALRRRADRTGALEQTIFIISGILGVISLLSKWKPEVVLTFFGLPSGAVALFIRKFYDIPYVLSLRGGDVPGFRPYDFSIYHKLSSPLLHQVWRRAYRVIANSNGLRNLALAFEPELPIGIIPNGVDSVAYQTAAREWSPARMLFTGRVVHQKGLDLLLGALSHLQEIPWELTIVGDGPQREPLAEKAKELHIDHRIIFTGWLGRQAVIAQYQQANMFVFPSRHEGMPNAVLEAMASGLPVIASRISGNEELVVPGSTGLLVPAEDQDSLEAALRTLLSNPTLRQRYGAAGYSKVAAEFSWTSVSQRYQELLAEAAGQR